MHASGYICIRAGADIAVDATDAADLANILQELGETSPRGVIKTWWLGEFQKTGPWWYRISNLDTHGPHIALWLVGQLCTRGWEVFQVDPGQPAVYHLRRTQRSD
jgi:hypothetical protein